VPKKKNVEDGERPKHQGRGHHEGGVEREMAHPNPLASRENGEGKDTGIRRRIGLDPTWGACTSAEKRQRIHEAGRTKETTNKQRGAPDPGEKAERSRKRIV